MAHTGRYRPSTSKNHSLANPLAGILKCKYCGKTMWLQPKKDRPNDSLRCPSLSCKNVQKGALFYLVEQRLIESLEKYIANYKTSNKIQIENEDNLHLFIEAITKKKEEKESLQAQKNTLHDFLEKGIYTVETFMERQQLLSENITKVNKDIQKLECELNKEEKKLKNTKETIPKIISVVEEYRSTTNIEKKNQLLKSVLEKVTFKRSKEMVKKDQFELEIFMRS
ncbi:hypothetical protein [Bacillus sp. 1P06AnD]|uniref:hypothetical protein n=1 Tax=Bacillus sp. 1P06AnD TaxID=3132208 RepID=UPI0039A0F7E6